MAVRKAIDSNIQQINIDLLFALPNQSNKDIEKDILTVLKYKPNQITYYPLFTFPYSEIAEFKQKESVQSPSIFKRRSMYYFIYNMMNKYRYNRCSVWSFQRYSDEKKYSSVTRERYMGFGASAGTYYEKTFTLNTFNVHEYIKSVRKRNHSVALSMNFTQNLSI